MNSVFICIECLVYQFRLMGICLGINSVFCPPRSYRYINFVRYFLESTFYLSEAMKSGSMITGLLFSIQRYVEATKTENARLKWISNLKMRTLYLFAIAYGVGLSWPILLNFEDPNYLSGLFNIPSIRNLQSTLFYTQIAQTILYFFLLLP